MSHPTDRDIARAIGVPVAVVSQLVRRGMPRAHVREAVEWFARHGLRYHDNKPHAARRANARNE